MIHVDEQKLNELKNAFETAGKDYKQKYLRLNALVHQIITGDISGKPAQDFLSKYEEKEDLFRGVLKTIEEHEKDMGIKSQDFNTMMDDLHSTMR